MDGLYGGSRTRRRQQGLPVVTPLVDAGTDRSISDRDGVKPLEHARARGYAEIVSQLEPAS